MLQNKDCVAVWFCSPKLRQILIKIHTELVSDVQRAVHTYHLQLWPMLKSIITLQIQLAMIYSRLDLTYK